MFVRFLAFLPHERIRAKDAMSHPYIAPILPFFAKQRPPQPIPTLNTEFEFENRKLSFEELRIELKREGKI